MAILAASMALLVGCFVLIQGKTFAVGTETNRVNIVIYKGLSDGLDGYLHAQGVAAARDLVLANTPSRVNTTTQQRTVMCAVGGAVMCINAGDLNRLILSWFKADVRNRPDFDDAVHQAKREGKCFAQTIVPSRNFTVKSIGTSGCRS